jgi:hypothetical protein
MRSGTTLVGGPRDNRGAGEGADWGRSAKELHLGEVYRQLEGLRVGGTQ